MDNKRYVAPLLWAAILVLGGVLAAVGLLTYAHVVQPALFGDTHWYAEALPALTSDAPLYDPAKLQPHPLRAPVFWDQAPSTAIFALVLLLPAGKLGWGLLMALALVIGFVLIWPRVGLYWTGILALVLLVFFPVTNALAWANLNSLVFCMLALALRFPRAAGVAIGVAAAAKLVPILGVFWLAGRRDWRGVAAAVAIPLAWKGPETLADFVTLRLNQWVPDGRFHWGLTDVLGFSPLAAMGVGGVLSVAAYWRASFSLAVIAMLASLPVLLTHYWTWLLIPFMAIWMPHVLRRPAMATPAADTSLAPVGAR